MMVDSIQWYKASTRQQTVQFIFFKDYMPRCALTEINVTQANDSMDADPDHKGQPERVLADLRDR